MKRVRQPDDFRAPPFRVWNAHTGAHRETWTQPHTKASVTALVLGDDDAVLVAAVGDAVTVRSLPMGKLQATHTGFRGNAQALCLLPRRDGVVLGSDDGTGYVLGLDGVVRGAVDHGDAVFSVACSGEIFATASRHGRSAIRLWRIDGTPAGELGTGRPHPPTKVALSPAGDVLYAAYNAAHVGVPTLVAWDVARATPRWERGSGDNVTDLALLDGGRRLVAAHQDIALRVWDADTGTIVHRFDCRPLTEDASAAPVCVAPMPDGGLFVALAYTRIVRFSRQGSVLSCDDPPRLAPHEGGVRALAFEREKTVVSLGHDGEIARWDLTLTNPPRRTQGTDADVAAIVGEPETTPARSPDGGVTLALPDGARALVATPGTVLVVDRATGQSLASLTGLAGMAEALAVSPSGRLAAASDGASLVVWKLPR